MTADCNDPRDEFDNWQGCDRDNCCDFYEEDEPVEDVIAAFERAGKVMPCDYRRASHRWVSTDGNAVLTSANVVGVPTYCGAPMTPLA